MDRKELQKEINAVYHDLELKQAEIFYAVFHRMFEVEFGWYNGHYHRNTDRKWCRESYPIPVISVKDFCDIEIQLDRITVSTKLKRKIALNYSFEKLRGYSFEAYGVEDYFAEYYHDGQTLQELKENIRGCDEKEIGFSFLFPFETEGKRFFEFVKLLRKEGFYY